jgi:hypothetical protein
MIFSSETIGKVKASKQSNAIGLSGQTNNVVSRSELPPHVVEK